MKKKIEIKNKIINHIMTNGKKKTSEKILLSSLKQLQKYSQKQSKKLIQLAIINSTPIFKLHKIRNKKQKKRNKKVREIPAFISNSHTRISLAIQFILATTKKQKTNEFYVKLKQKVLENVQQKGLAVGLKNDSQKQVLLNKRYFTYYKWK